MFNEQPFEVFSEVDDNADGLISYDETITFWEKKLGTNSSRSLQSIHRKDTKREYQDMDTNWDGYIQPEEFDRQLLLLSAK